MKILGKLLKIIFLLFLACALIAVGYYLAVTKNVSLDSKKLVISEKNVTVYDINGESIQNVASLFPKQTVGADAIPAFTKQAFVDTEDRRFYSHQGFDIKRIAKAAINNVKAHSFKEGASTISQQLIKNTHLSQEKTLKRKLQEWKLTRQLEKKYSKDEILEKYLNSIYFGHSCFGIKAAADFYFNKTPQELNLADSAILAGLVKSPNNYSPFKHPEKCLKRKESVLNAMLKNKSITLSQKQEAMNCSLPLPSAKKNAYKGYLHFVFDELATLSEESGFQVGGSIEISTYLDPTLQSQLEKLSENYTDFDKSIFVLDNQTHGFKACVSSVGNIPRLPGSLIKPLLVYAPAIEEDLLVPATPILDEKVNYNGYAPENYDGEYRGYVSARECVEKSLNIPAVKVLSSLGVKKGVAYLKKMRLETEQEDESLALALGGMKKGFTLKQILEAYSLFPNQGQLFSCGFISKIKINGVSVFHKKENKQQVFSKETSYLMTDILKGTAKEGTAKKLRNLPFDIAAKTGTVGTKNGNTDAYALSFTSKDSIGVWFGNQDNTKIDCTGGGLPCNLLLSINEYLYKKYQSENITIPNFQKPNTIVEVDLDKTAYYDTHTLLLADKQAPIEYKFTELFKNSSIPTKQATPFSKPTIPTPKLQLKGGIIHIIFDEKTPVYYQYKIEKYSYATHNTYVKHSTLYFGNLIDVFKDKEIEPDRQFVYTVTPVYKNTVGKTVVLPTVSTKREKNEKKDNEIIQEEWWDY